MYPRQWTAKILRNLTAGLKDLVRCACCEAEAGASEFELMALFGWTDPKMARVYTKSANAKKLSLQAAARVGAGADILDLFDDQQQIADGPANGQGTNGCPPASGRCGQ